MHKRLLAIALALCLLVSAAPAAAALSPRGDINDVSGFYAKQQRSNTCTLASAAMMVRRRAYLDGLENWADLTESRLRRVAWSYVGLSHQFTISGITVGYGDFDRSQPVEGQIIALLQTHPEGIVVYNRSYPHAILVTDYTDGTLYCSDPAQSAPYGRYPVSQASIRITNAHSFWYVTRDTNVPQGVGVSLAASDIVYPVRLAPGSGFSLGGALTSPTTISTVQLNVETDGGTLVQSAAANPADTRFEMSALDDQLDFSALPTGSYTLTLTATDEYGGCITLRKALMVAGSETVAENYSGSAPVLQEINAVNLTETGFDVECTATAPAGSTVSVLCSAWANNSQFAPGLVAERDGDRFTTHVTANAALLDFDSLLINITAMDTDGNTSRGTLLVQISPDENSENVVVDQKLL